MYRLENPELNLSGAIYGTAPVQAEGTINGFLFYFRARHDQWTFAVSEYPEIDPVDIQTTETGKQHGYFASGQYGNEFDYAASYMEIDHVKEIIHQCSRDYLTSKGKT
jgi:hypothetical protein